MVQNLGETFMKAFILHQANYKHGLKIIGIESTTYADTWIGRTTETSSDIDNFLAPRIFYIERHRNITGYFTPILTLIAEGTATEAKEYSSHLRIFEPC